MVVYVQGDNGASGEGGLDGTVNEHGLVSGFRDDFKTIAAATDKMGGPETLTGYSAGWAFCDEHPVSLGQADVIPLWRNAQWRGYQLAWPDSGPRRSPQPVSPCHRYHADHP